MDLKKYIGEIPDFPAPGILFYDVAPLFANAEALRAVVGRLAALAKEYAPNLIAGVESRGFPLASAVALELGLGMLMVRKPGKLPGAVLRHEYRKEYGTDALEITAGLVTPGTRVVVVDDLLATGGSFAAATTLLQTAGATVPAGLFVVELASLGGRKKASVTVASLISY